MAGPFLEREVELFVQLESTYGTSPGALAGTDAIKHTSGRALTRKRATAKRDGEKSGSSASVTTQYAGRENSEFSIETYMVPSGTVAVAPDVTDLLEAHFGTKLTPTAATTTTSGSSGVSLVLTTGGVAASGIVVGMLIAVDQDGAGNFEVRRVTGISTDTLTLDLAFTTASVATGRAVQPLTTYKFSSSAAKSAHIWEYVGGNNFRHKAGGCIVSDLAGDIDNSQQVPMGTFKFSGKGLPLSTHSTSEPTRTTAGDALVPTVGAVWIGSTKGCAVKAGFASNNGLELRETEGCSLVPTGAKRTANNGRFNVTASLSVLLTTGTVEGYYDNASAQTAYSVIVQLGDAAGKRVVWCMPKFIPDTQTGVEAGELSLDLNGNALATNGDDEIYLGIG